MDKTMDKTIELIKEKLAQVEKIEPIVKIMPLKSVAVILTQIKESIENEIQLNYPNKPLSLIHI